MAVSYEERVYRAAVTEQPYRLQEEILQIAEEQRTTEAELRKWAQEYALAENTYRMAKAKLLLEADGKTVSEKQAWVDLRTPDERIAAHSAEHMKHALTEISRSQRQRMSAMQSLLRSQQVEMELAGRHEQVQPQWSYDDQGEDE